MMLRKGRGEQRIAKIYDSPCLPESGLGAFWGAFTRFGVFFFWGGGLGVLGHLFAFYCLFDFFFSN